MGILQGKHSKCIINFFFLILPIAFPFVVLSQIQGTIHDNKNQPLSFANVLLINHNDSSVVTGLIAPMLVLLVGSKKVKAVRNRETGSEEERQRVE